MVFDLNKEKRWIPTTCGIFFLFDLFVSYFEEIKIKKLSYSKKRVLQNLFQTGSDRFFCFFSHLPNGVRDNRFVKWASFELSEYLLPLFVGYLRIGKWVSPLSLRNQCTYCGFHLSFVFISSFSVFCVFFYASWFLSRILFGFWEIWEVEKFRDFVFQIEMRNLP